MLRSATASKAIPAESDPNDADPTNEPSSASAQGGSEEAPSTDRSNFYLQNRETFACLRLRLAVDCDDAFSLQQPREHLPLGIREPNNVLLLHGPTLLGWNH